jgi:Ca-activated chloride channel family protein
MSVRAFLNHWRLLGGVVIMTTALIAAFGQEGGPRLLENVVRPPARQHAEHAIRVDVNLVLVPVTVTDRKGRVVNGLERDNFQVFDEAIAQQIVSFSNEDVPTSVGLVLDVSGSMAHKMSKARLAARAFLDTLNPADETFLMTFSDQPKMEVDFTSNPADIQNGFLFAKAGGSTALVDAVYLALRRMRSARNPRKALLVISDGGDNSSRYSEKELRRVAVEADVQIHAVGIHDSPGAPEEMNGPYLLDGLAKLTGGQHFLIRDASELTDVAAKIGVALHDQYVIGYYPPSNSLAEKWRKIRVTMAVPKGLPALQVYARSGYYPPAH